jgi:aryl-alcohol dehydrogenase-like predicted oxidoreductase
LQLDYVDIVFAHRFDSKTPLEEICRGFNEIIEDGKAFYWGTSDWDPA